MSAQLSTVLRHCAVALCSGLGVNLHAYLILVLDGEWSVSLFDCFDQVKEFPVITK